MQFILLTVLLCLGLLVFLLWRNQKTLFATLPSTLQNHLSSEQQINLARLEKNLALDFTKIHQSIDKRQVEGMQLMQESMQSFIQDFRHQITGILTTNTETLGTHFKKLTTDTNQRLQEISGQVEKRLADGFEKTTATFMDIVKRLALIDEAQRKITELSAHVVSLQEIFVDKRARGAFGEIQLNQLLRNVLPESSFSLQHTLSNGKRADCVLFMPPPTGTIAIDAKFPLESYRKMIAGASSSEYERKALEQQFRQDLRKHIHDIADKYLIPGETADGAVMFIPAEAIFAEIHAFHPEIIEEAHQARVWMTSPTTMMAVLTTARAVLKDEDTRKQIHIIKDHLLLLGKDFERFQGRMDNLARHIEQAHDDVKDVHISAKKISTRFQRIEQVQLESENG